MKNAVVLVTDSVSNLPAALAKALGVSVVPASYAFEDERMFDGTGSADALYIRIETSGAVPRTFGPTEKAWTEAFNAGLERAEAVACLVTPFDVTSSFTTASAAMLAIQFDRPEAQIKIVNPGVGSAGLASLLVTLAGGLASGWGMEQLLDELEELEPQCDAVFVPKTVDWLERSGRLALIEERLRELDGDLPVLRVGTRITGVARGATPAKALEQAVKAAGKRANPGAALNVTVLHADAPALADDAAAKMRAAYNVAHMAIAPMTATIGAQLGPGAIGIGVAPAQTTTR